VIALLDANMLIALFDGAHVHHQSAHDWLRTHRDAGWATCPLTENGCVRIISQPAYPGRLPVADIARRLRHASASSDHHFWADTISISDPARFDHDRVLSSRHLTNLYLLALAVANRGCLVTFDRKIPSEAVPAATAENLITL
jgi:toxin-antitoxin system PIN domain toxin